MFINRIVEDLKNAVVQPALIGRPELNMPGRCRTPASPSSLSIFEASYFSDLGEEFGLSDIKGSGNFDSKLYSH